MSFNNHLMIERAKLYAIADSSDPFAYRRARTHLANGVASYSTSDGKEGFYSAEAGLEERQLPPDPISGKPGEKYMATVYRNRFRP